MGILDEPQETTATKVAKVRENISFQVRAEIQRVKQTIEGVFNLIWNPPFGLTAQDIFDSYGTSAGALFQEMSDSIDYVHIFEPNWQAPTPPLPFTINQDGTVTIG